MSWPVQDHADAVLALLAADAQLTVYDGAVPRPPAVAAVRYALVYLYAETPGADAEPDKVRLSMNSDVIHMRINVHCVGESAMAARAISGRVRFRLQNVIPAVTGRTCFPIEWVDGQAPQRNEEVLSLSMDQVDVYSLKTVPG